MHQDTKSHFSSASVPPIIMTGTEMTVNPLNEIDLTSGNTERLGSDAGGGREVAHLDGAFEDTWDDGEEFGTEVSDIPRLRSIHSTAGYREGIASSKETCMQEGFDEGYMLGAEVGVRAGWCLGVLEGIVNALGNGEEKNVLEVRSLLREAREELGAKNLYKPEYFAEDGIWKYDVPIPGLADAQELAGENKGTDAEEELDFRRVANAHPVIRKWMGIIEELARDLGLDLGVLKDRVEED